MDAGDAGSEQLIVTINNITLDNLRKSEIWSFEINNLVNSTEEVYYTFNNITSSWMNLTDIITCLVEGNYTQANASLYSENGLMDIESSGG
jgi:hypothetical protein